MTSCVISGLPLDITLGDVEALISPMCSGRIVSIGIQGEGVATVDFALQTDCDSVLGDHEVKGVAVNISRPGGAAVQPMSDDAAQGDVQHAVLSSIAAGGSSSSSASTGAIECHGSAPGSTAAVEPGSSLDAHSTSGMASNAVYSTAGAEDAGASAAPAVKKQRSDGGPPGESKKEKEKRLNRVGLSYRCGRCGMPKKGHVCPGGDGPLPPGDGMSAGMLPSDLAGISPTSASWDLDSDSIFKDIKSVLQTPSSSSASSTQVAAEAPAKANGM